MNQNRDWWKTAVIYQIYPRSFLDTNDDGIGDLPGITQKLEYVADLGVDAVWISPFFTSPMKDFGYDVSDYRNVDPTFWTLDDFRKLLSKAHSLGLRIIIDQVLSHTSDQHAWFKEGASSLDNPKSDWYVWADAKPDGTPPNNWHSVFWGSMWQWHSKRRQYYLHNFLTSQPDLNFHNEEVRGALVADIRFWMEMGVDGFRFDACNHYYHDAELRDNPAKTLDDTPTNPYGWQIHSFDKSRPEVLDFLKTVRKNLDEFGAVSVGEIGDDDSLRLMKEYTEGGDALHMAYSFDFLWDDGSAEYFARRLPEIFDGIGNWTVCLAFGNHDSKRLSTRWANGDEEAVKTYLALLLSFGCPVTLYQGDEFGMEEADVPFEKLQDPYGKTFWPEFKGRDGCRIPMSWTAKAPYAGFSSSEPWLPVAAEYAAKNAENDGGDCVRAFLKKMIAWRKSENFQGTPLISNVGGLLNIRWENQNGDASECVFNLSSEPLKYPYEDENVLMASSGEAGRVLGGKRFRIRKTTA